MWKQLQAAFEHHGESYVRSWAEPTAWPPLKPQLLCRSYINPAWGAAPDSLHHQPRVTRSRRRRSRGESVSHSSCRPKPRDQRKNQNQHQLLVFWQVSDRPQGRGCFRAGLSTDWQVADMFFRAFLSGSMDQRRMIQLWKNQRVKDLHSNEKLPLWEQRFSTL